jgi:hypothetical protein
VAIVDLVGGIATLLPLPPAQGLVDGAVPGETLDPCDRTMAALLCDCVVFPLGGFVFGAGHRQVGPMEGQGGCVETPVVTMMASSYVGDVALVAVVGSSPTCSWVCLGLFVAVKSKLRWRVLVAYDDWQLELTMKLEDISVSI